MQRSRPDFKSWVARYLPFRVRCSLELVTLTPVPLVSSCSRTICSHAQCARHLRAYLGVITAPQGLGHGYLEVLKRPSVVNRARCWRPRRVANKEAPRRRRAGHRPSRQRITLRPDDTAAMHFGVAPTE